MALTEIDKMRKEIIALREDDFSLKAQTSHRKSRRANLVLNGVPPEENESENGEANTIHKKMGVQQ